PWRPTCPGPARKWARWFISAFRVRCCWAPRGSVPRRSSAPNHISGQIMSRRTHGRRRQAAALVAAVLVAAVATAATASAQTDSGSGDSTTTTTAETTTTTTAQPTTTVTDPSTTTTTVVVPPPDDPGAVEDLPAEPVPVVPDTVPPRPEGAGPYSAQAGRIIRRQLEVAQV